jgi:serine/threonine protein kinase
VNHAEPDAYTFIFRIPSGFSQPRSLRSCLQNMRGTDSLSDRFRLGNELARSVSYVHTFGFVHKNIRPETILLLRSEESAIGSIFLVGFDSFRMAEGKTLRKGHSAWERCLYQHPSRMGSTPTEDYIMQHDIYSLGVCLLELGLWESLVVYDDQESCLPNDGTATNATRSAILGVDLLPLAFKDRLLSLARGELRSRMGTRYSEIVVTCLTCLDPGNIDFGDESEFQDEDGIQVGVRYIEKVSL